ncbi:hypothetical protein TWF694_005417 [Orbilia ellipsospora]|uniref:Cytochrome P450 n=1 Tax=Orbilia ellipsospora TaxID=2528407 RepID=A0AAV9WU88_9PEZI
MGALSFGESFNSLEDAKLVNAVDGIMAAGKSMGIWLNLPAFGKNQILFKIRPFLRWLIFSAQDVKNFQNYLDVVVGMATRRIEREHSSGRDEKVQSSLDKDIFHYILHSKDPETGESLTTSELLAEARACVFAGTDTTATALACSFYYLGYNPEILAKLRGELRAIFASEEEIIYGPKLKACMYLKRVIEEVLRISNPVGGILWRETTTEYYCIGGYRLPKETDVGVPIYAIHHNSDYFPNPHEFNPDRWDDAVVGAESVTAARKAWMPFQYGSRACTGRSLALMELNLTLARIIFSHEIRIDQSRRTDVQVCIDGANPEFETKDQLAAETVGPYLQFRKVAT